MKYKKYLVAVSALMVLGMPLAAAQQSNSEVGPGLVGSDSMFYGLETAWDNAAVSVGLKKASDVAQERAAEAKSTAEKGNWKAAQKAADNMASVAKKARNNETQGLQKAETVLREVMQNAPEQAQQGLQKALENVQKERDRVGKPGNISERALENATAQDRPEQPNRTMGSGKTENSTAGQRGSETAGAGRP